MRTEHIFVNWSCIRIKGEVSREKKKKKNWFKRPPKRFFYFASVILYVAFALSLFSLHLSFFCCLGITKTRLFKYTENFTTKKKN